MCKKGVEYIYTIIVWIINLQADDEWGTHFSGKDANESKILLGGDKYWGQGIRGSVNDE